MLTTYCPTSSLPGREASKIKARSEGDLPKRRRRRGR